MKCLYILFLLLPFWCISQNHELRDEIRKNIRLEDSIVKLNREISLITLEKKSSLDSLNYRLNELNKELENWSKFKEERKELKNINKQLSEIQIENQVLNEQLILLESIKSKNEQLQNELIHLSENNNTLKADLDDFNNIKTNLKNIKDNKDIYLLNLVNRYQSTDEVIANFSLQTLKLDLEYVKLFAHDQIELIGTIERWITIRNAKDLLSVKFNETAIQEALLNLDKISDNKIIIELKKDLNEYASKNNVMIKLIDKLNQINAIKVKGTTTDLIQQKRKDIYSVLSIELDYNAEINRAKYTYLNDIIEVIKKTKDIDIDADLSFVKDLL